MKKYSKETVVGVFMVLGLACIGYLTIQVGDVGIIGDNSYTLNARFTRVTGLRTGSSVQMLGLEVGRVGHMRMDQEKQVAIVELRIDKGIKVYEDAIASIKTEGLIGDKFVSIDAGGGGDLLKPGEMIVETESPADIMDLVSKYAFGDVNKCGDSKKRPKAEGLRERRSGNMARCRGYLGSGDNSAGEWRNTCVRCGSYGCGCP